MPDIIIREEEGWIEITSLAEETLSEQVIEDLWDLLAEDKKAEAVELLDHELGGELQARTGHACIQTIKMVDIPGEGIRIWVRR